MERLNAWNKYDEDMKKKVFDFADEYRRFISLCKTERECVEEGVRILKASGYKDLKDVIAADEKLKAGDKVYAVNMNKAIVAFNIGETSIESGMNILGAHIDSPRLDIKQNPLYEETGLVLLDTHYYGGIKKYQWVATPLALHGVVALKDGTTVKVVIGEDIDDTVVGISDLLIHLASEQMDKKAAKVVEGEALDILVGSMPLKQESAKSDKEDCKDAVKKNILALLKEKYGINEENIQKARKIMTVRYEISRNGYSNIKPVIISKSISYLSANQIKEQSSSFPGTSVVTTPIVTYPYGSLASHILGYVGSISSEEYNANKEKYDINDIIGKTGIQYTLEEYLKGEDGIRQVDMSVDGTITEQHIAEEAEAGHTVTLTIDSNLQKVTEEALKKNIKDIANGSYGQKYNAKAGAAVVMDVKSGEILALASYPDYEPELFISGITQKKLEEYNKGNNYYNRAISGTYAPRFSI